MPQADPKIAKVAEELTRATRGIPLVNWIFIVIMAIILGKLVIRVGQRR